MKIVTGLLLSLVLTASAEDLASRVLVVFNESEPESKTLADYYVQRRGIPTNQVCGIRVRAAELISRKEFIEQVREPILKFMTDRNLLFQLPAEVKDPVLGTGTVPVTYENKITFLALIYGVPLKIDRDDDYLEKNIDAKAPAERRRTEASVDSELAWLPTARVPLGFAVPNPFFNKAADFDKRMNNSMVLVARLDGPEPAIVRRMIDDAIATEKTGLHGRAYFDERKNVGPELAAGDQWIADAARYVRDAGFETVVDEKPEVFPEDFPMTDVAIYAGWYIPDIAGPFKKPGFKFRPGAVGYHLHSLSAFTLRTREDSWVAPMLARGATAAFGNVFEPYLAFTPRVDLFFKRLLAGATFAEAGWYSEPVLSWQTVFVGDPLYRPFALKKN